MLLQVTMGTDTTVSGEQEHVGRALTARAGSRFVKVLNFILAQWLVIGFGLGCVFGYLFPRK